MRAGTLGLLLGGILFGSVAGAVAADRQATRLVAEEPLPGPEAGARKATDAERKAVAGAIEAQLKAFKADDYATAMKYQSAALREQVDNADDFRRMIKNNYPQFARYKSISYGNATCDSKADRVAIQVTLTGEDKITIKAIYLMVKEKDGYKVDGVEGGIKPRLDPRDTV
jgi:hypothetical protein